MRLSQVLFGPPVFHFWKHFGAGKRPRYNHYRTWKMTWRNEIARKKVADHTLCLTQLPPGSRIIDAEDFLKDRQDENVIYDHPWPYNVHVDPIKNQKLVYNYTISSRFFVPRLDCQVLTNTLLETDQLDAHPPIEPTAEHLEIIQRQYDWATRGDSVLVRLPNKREFPKINIRPRAKYGLTKERQEFNVLKSFQDVANTLLAKHYHELKDQEKLNEILSRRSTSFPHCKVPFERESCNLNLELFIDHMSLSNKPLPLVNSTPEETRDKDAATIQPRSWRSLLEKTNNYVPNWYFTLPKNANLHTIFLASRIKRTHLNPDEMLARSMIHAFGLASQFARLRNLLDEPISLQTISYDLEDGSFQFMKYQLNSTEFDDNDPMRLKNQAWHSGPIKDLHQALRYFLDFQS